MSKNKNSTGIFCFKIVFTLSLIVYFLNTINAPADQTGSSLTNNLLAISVCPPWKPAPPEVCINGINAVAGALSERLEIDSGNQHFLLNRQGTVNGLRAMTAELAKTLGPTDRLIVYANVHGGPIDAHEAATPANDVLVLWSEEKPKALAFAVAEEKWIMASEFARLVNGIPAAEIIVMIDACESAAASPLFFHKNPENDPARSTAVVVSAQSDQFAIYNESETLSLFTEEMSKSLAGFDGTLAGAVAEAAKATAKAAVPICDGQSAELQKLGLDPRACRQIPATHDPDGLLDRIPLGPGKTKKP